MKTNGLELNVNDLIDEVIDLVEHKEMYKWEIEKMQERIERMERQRQSDQALLKAYEQKGAKL